MSAPVYQEAARMVGICNSCRYCEGYCAVFPAIERRIDFARVDLDYLANLCHNCGACYSACQYAPPHEFAVNIPRMLAQVRFESYETYAWPRALGALFRRQPTLICTANRWLTGVVLRTRHRMARRWLFPGVHQRGLVLRHFSAQLFDCNLRLDLRICVRFDHDGCLAFLACYRATRLSAPRGATAAAMHDAATLTYLGGGGEGCSEAHHAPARSRALFHHLTFYGFLLCLASTSVASIYHYALAWPAPYPLLSAPVLLGTIGGMGLVIGTTGLLWLRTRRPAELHDPSQIFLDAGFTWLLLITGATGLMLLVLRESAWMPALLALHLGPVLALFLLLPYGKFVHGIYRALALVKYRRERDRTNRYDFE